MFNLMSIKIFGSLSVKLLSIQSILNLYCCAGLFCLRCRTPHLLFLDLRRFLLAHLSNLWRSLRMAVLPSNITYQLLSPTWCHLQTCWRSLSPTVQVINEEFKQHWPQYGPQGNRLYHIYHWVDKGWTHKLCCMFHETLHEINEVSN